MRIRLVILNRALKILDSGDYLYKMLEQISAICNLAIIIVEVNFPLI